MSMKDYESISYRPWANLHMEAKDKYYCSGIYEHPLGVVRVVRFPEVTQLYYIKDGIEHARRWGRGWGNKTISRLAREFLEDMNG